MFSPGSFILCPAAQPECFSAQLHPVLSAKALQKYPLKASQTVSDIVVHACLAKRPWSKKKKNQELLP